MLQKYCACHEKVEPRHTNSCNCHCKVTPFRDMKFATLPRILRRRLQTSTSQSAKSLRLPRETHRFGPSSNPPRLPTFLQPSRTPAPATYFTQRVEIPAPATRNGLSTSKNVPSTWCFNDFDFRIALARRRGTNFAKLNFQKCSEHAAWCLFFVKNALARTLVQILSSSTSKSDPTPPVFNDFDFQIALARRRGANFVDVNFQKCSGPASFSRF